VQEEEEEEKEEEASTSRIGRFWLTRVEVVGDGRMGGWAAGGSSSKIEGPNRLEGEFARRGN
jgi:hypothetical protein